ncbi:hypothetical protein GEMRC1_006653 [Eukaryota sp. GEM-RC1]
MVNTMSFNRLLDSLHQHLACPNSLDEILLNAVKASHDVVAKIFSDNMFLKNVTIVLKSVNLECSDLLEILIALAINRPHRVSKKTVLMSPQFFYATQDLYMSTFSLICSIPSSSDTVSFPMYHLISKVQEQTLKLMCIVVERNLAAKKMFIKFYENSNFFDTLQNLNTFEQQSSFFELLIAIKSVKSFTSSHSVQLPVFLSEMRSCVDLWNNQLGANRRVVSLPIKEALVWLFKIFQFITITLSHCKYLKTVIQS